MRTLIFTVITMLPASVPAQDTVHSYPHTNGLVNHAEEHCTFIGQTTASGDVTELITSNIMEAFESLAPDLGADTVFVGLSGQYFDCSGSRAIFLRPAGHLSYMHMSVRDEDWSDYIVSATITSYPSYESCLSALEALQDSITVATEDGVYSGDDDIEGVPVVDFSCRNPDE